jgi:hypothetical protein
MARPGRTLISRNSPPLTGHWHHFGTKGKALQPGALPSELADEVHGGYHAVLNYAHQQGGPNLYGVEPQAVPARD